MKSKITLDFLSVDCVRSHFFLSCSTSAKRDWRINLHDLFLLFAMEKLSHFLTQCWFFSRVSFHVTCDKKPRDWSSLLSSSSVSFHKKKELTIEWNIDELEISFSFVDYQSSSLCDCGEIKSYQVEMFHQVSLLCFAQAARKSHSSEAEMRRKGFKFASLSLALRFICWSSRSCFVNGEKVHVTRNWLHSRRLSVSRLNSWMRYSNWKTRNINELINFLVST